jgi:hypothetical protein
MAMHRRATGALAASAFALAVAMFAPASVGEEARGFPPKVQAVYSITWNGVEFGTFTFNSDVKDGRYTLSGDAKLSALLGAFSWRGITRSLGAVGAQQPSPSVYAFKFDGNNKTGRVDMRFKSNAIDKVVSDPPVRNSPGRIPITKTHLRGVVDPLSAVMAVASAGGGKVTDVNPCKRTIPIFDGKQRFDLVFSYLRKERLESAGTAFVCRIRYVPVAGHKWNDETKYMAANTGIEITLIPVPQANLFVPYKVVIPTQYGEASLASSDVKIDVPGIGRVALSN